MIRALYTLGVKAYSLGIRLASPWNAKAKAWIKGRSAGFPAFPEKKPGEFRVWFHCASLGEFEQGRPVMEALLHTHPHLSLIVTFFSPSGFEVRKNYAPALRVLYLPLDTPYNARRFVRESGVDMAVFVKYEFWYNYLNALYLASVPTFFVSALFRPSQVFFKSWGKWFIAHLHQAAQIFVQDESSLKLCQQAGLQNITLSGDTRFDRVMAVAGVADPFPEIRAFIGGRPCVVAGSTWPGDEQVLAAAWKKMQEVVFILAPHDIRQERIEEIQRYFGEKGLLFSYLKAASEGRLIIIDNVGMLSMLYAYADVCWVGGAFDSGLHNILEAAAHGKPVLFGPHTDKFPEAGALIEAGGGLQVGSMEQATYLLHSLINKPEEARRAGLCSKQFISANQGATAIITAHLAGYILNKQKVLRNG
jgi:3-deoxy-D-manno-octulosonic-acid transferase